MSAPFPSIGIDFGTSKSSMAWFNPETGQGEILRNAEGKDETPSVVYYGAGEILVGSPAEDMLEDPEKRKQVVRSVKRDLVNAPRLSLPGRRVTTLEVAAEIFRKLKRDAEELHFHRPVRHAVITHPAAFDELQLEKIKEAANLAGFEEVALVPEPVAAALAYAHAGLQVGQFVLVYDLGGGTFDLALLAREDQRRFRVARPPKGLSRCGGDDFDRALYDHCDEAAHATLGRGITVTDDIDQLFLRQCRTRKETLSSAERCGFSAYLAGPDGAVHFKHEVSRATFEGLIEPTIEATVRLTGGLIEEARSFGMAVDTVVLIGGSSRVPLIARRLQETLPVPPQKWQKQDVAVALGAGLQAHYLWDPPAASRPTGAGQGASAGGGARQETGSSQRAGQAAGISTGTQQQAGAGAGGARQQAGAGQAASASGSAAKQTGAWQQAGAGQRTVASSSARQQAGTVTSSGEPVASFGQRVGAYLIDWVIIWVVMLILLYGSGSVQTNSVDNSTTLSPLGYVIIFLIPTVYFCWFWAQTGRTPGYLVLGLKLEQRGGGKLTAGYVLVRYIGFLVSGWCLCLGYLWMLWDPRHETWADKMANTQVVPVKTARS